MYGSTPESEHREFIAVTRALTTTVENGEFGDRVVAEHMLRVLGAATQILTEHSVDGMGRCCACRRFHRFRLRPQNRTPCAVHDTFMYFFKGRRRFPTRVYPYAGNNEGERHDCAH
jgi:hypothetical protein